MRWSGTTGPNEKLVDWTAEHSSDNNDKFFLDALAALEEDGTGNQGHMVIGFLGQRDIPGFCLRTAQSTLRWDRRPSLWSHMFLIGEPVNADTAGATPIYEVPIYNRLGQFPEPGNNAVSVGRLDTYSDPAVEANVALVAVAMNDDEVTRVKEGAQNFNRDRLRYDFWEALGAWQPYVWSVGQTRNPLEGAIPIPSAAYVQMAFEEIGLDLTPGASEAHSAPEHIWTAVRWWHEALEHANNHSASGYYVVRDPGCSLRSAPPPLFAGERPSGEPAGSTAGEEPSGRAHGPEPGTHRI
jgi:hypothetical protein